MRWGATDAHWLNGRQLTTFSAKLCASQVCIRLSHCLHHFTAELLAFAVALVTDLTMPPRLRDLVAGGAGVRRAQEARKAAQALGSGEGGGGADAQPSARAGVCQQDQGKAGATGAAGCGRGCLLTRPGLASLQLR